MGWSVYTFATEADTIRWGTYFLIFFLAFQLFGEDDSARAFRRVFTIYAFALAVVSILQYFLGNGRIYWLFESAETAGLGPFLNRDHYASFVALVLPVAAVEMVRHPHRRWFFALAMAVLYASVIAGASRAGFVLVTLEMLILFALLGFPGRTVWAVVALMVAFGFVVGWGTLYDRLGMPDPYAGRREVAAATVRMIEANPWKGIGMGTWTNVYPAYASKDFGVFINAAHNDWLQWGAEGGIPMLSCLLLLFGASVFLVRKVPWVLGSARRLSPLAHRFSAAGTVPACDCPADPRHRGQISRRKGAEAPDGGCRSQRFRWYANRVGGCELTSPYVVPSRGLHEEASSCRSDMGAPFGVRDLARP